MFNRLIITVAILLCCFSGVRAEPLHLEDELGRHIFLTEPAKRIVTTFMPANLFVLSLGLADKLVGIGGSTKHSYFISHILSEYNPSVVGNRSAGINLETIISLKPDLVLVYGKKDGVRLADRLASLGIASVIIQPESFTQADFVINLLAKATGTERRATKIQAENLRLREIISKGLAGLATEDRIQAYYANSSDLYRTVSQQMFQHQLLELAGINNVAEGISGFYPKVNTEQLLLWDPDVLVRESNDSNKVEQQLQQASMQSLSRLKQIHIPKESFWDMPSPMAIAGALYLAVNAYPDRFKEIDLQAELARYYQISFGDACLSPIHETAKCQFL
ncbi:MAG: ABC transporter substrate-binding protein [Shewanella sp.]